MNLFSLLAVGAVLTGAAFGTTFINISTGTNNANWQVSGPGIAVPIAATSLTVSQQNGTWAPAPISISPISGANWVSYSSVQGTSCVVGQTPGNGCANALNNPNGDAWTYSLNLSAAALAGNSGVLNFIFGADNRVVVGVGNGGPSQAWNTGTPTNGNAFNPLACSGTPPTSAGNTQAQYNNCVGTVAFFPGNLNGDGSLTLTAVVTNDPIPACPACGDPTGFVLEGTISSSQVATPEPSTFALIGLAGIVGLVLRRRRSPFLEV